MGIIHERIHRPNFLTITADKLFNWSRLSSLWMLFYGLACCGIEAMAAGISRYDFDRYGIIPRATPRQADLMIVAGPVSRKMVPVIRTLYSQMAEPKFVVNMGACAISGGWSRDSYNIVRGAHKIIPVDVHVPGCHPRPEGLLYGLLELQNLIRQQSFLEVRKQLAENPLVVPEDVTKDDILYKAEGRE